MNSFGVSRNPLTRLFLFSLLVATCIALTDARASAQETYKTSEGDSVTINLRAGRECIFLNEPVTLRLEIGNDEEHVYEFVYREAKPVVTLLVAGGNGDSIREILPNGTIGCVAPRFERDNTERYFPDDTVFHLFENIFFKTPGNYRVTLEKQAMLRNRGTSAITEILIRASLNLEVVENTPARTSAATIEHGRRLLEEGPDFYETIRWIEAVHDESAIPFLALILSRHHNAPQREENEEQPELIATLAHVTQVAYVLGTFQDDRSLEALRKGMTSPNDLIRRAVGRALWSSKHPRAHSLFLSMWRDPDWGTRDNIA